MSRNIFNSLVLTLALLATACQADPGNSDHESRTAIGKADSIGSCAGACGDISQAGDCYCDELCAEYGDCCSDVAAECQLDECNPVDGSGCSYGEVCSPGVCLAFCQPQDPGCCAPATCEPIAPPPLSCEDLGGSCESSPLDVTFGANCEGELGRVTIPDGECPAFNQSCCGGPLECPAINPPAPGFCDDDEELKPIEEFGCVIGFECVGQDSCDALGGFCSPASVGCPADTAEEPDAICDDADSVCCSAIIWPF